MLPPFVAIRILRFHIGEPFEKAMVQEYKHIVATTNTSLKDRNDCSSRFQKDDSCRVLPNPHHISIGAQAITVDNDQSFKSVALYKLDANYHIKGNHSSRYYVSANELVEAFNKTVYTILENMVGKNEKTSPDKLPKAL